MPTTLFRPFSICVCVVFSFPCFAQTPANPPSPKKKPLPAVKMARWNNQDEKLFGVSHEEFANMGLSKLTQDEYGLLLLWISAQNTNAEQKGKEEGQASALTYSCGLNFDEAAAAARVNLFIVDEKDTSATLMSGIRQRLRTIPDVQIVYDKKDADLSIDVIGFEIKMAGSNVTTGYAAPIITTSPCIAKFGTTESNFQKYEDAILQTGGDSNLLVERIVTALDSNDIEPIRRNHAAMKKFLQEQKKSQ